MRGGAWTGLGVAVALGCGVCSASRSEATEPATPSTPDGSAPAEVCLPMATCGCFTNAVCVTARVCADGVTVDITSGPRAGEQGMLLHDCPPADGGTTECVDYLECAMLCRRLGPLDDRLGKYLCSTDDTIPDFRCGFREGVCSKL